MAEKIRKIYVDDVGTKITINMGANIVGSTEIEFNVLKPEADSEVKWIPSIEGTDSFRYTVISGDLNIAGYYRIRPSFTLGAWSGSGNIVGFSVEPK